MMKKLTFGKIHNETVEKSRELNTTVLLPINDIAPNPNQPRQAFDQVDIVTLADSIRQHGLLQPISVRYADFDENFGTSYVLIAGERRLRAMKMLSYTEIPCLIIDITAREAAELAIIENIMRKDLSIFELAEAISLLLSEYGMTQEELGKRLSTSQSNIANKLRLLRYTSKERAVIEEFHLSERHARAILRLEEPEKRFRALIHVGTHGMTVKDTESYVENLLLPKEKPAQQSLSFTHREARSLLMTSIQKPLSKLAKRGLAIASEEIESDTELRLIFTIPKNTDCF